ncbi:TPA: glycosyltransferase family 4 protein [Burkholderia aenigmatica]|nr:glycosyltransferase family 4 protein [Burkholderia aenigmatica]HDR9519726.1 glycosyltransferase family 4 protein [Burkholderia aenigmatica]HDR9596756.1 glycosyltransferase family 4 protein [Burkholderia aenigmatica]HDR9604153.1 glycosyltransferase family 4 protein [Burkholderia aenigmatica]HDR9611740.1 glycosyltransferase family 4 protein [Burkholderia aenigmatica]
MIRKIKAILLTLLATRWAPHFTKDARRAVRSIRTGKLAQSTASRQLLVDVSIIAVHDAGTGIQRVVRSLLRELISEPPPGFVVRPVMATRKQRYRYADQYFSALTGSAPPSAEAINVDQGDIFLGLDLTSRILPRRQADLLEWRAKGVRHAFVVYDLLPATNPDWFTRRSSKFFQHWVTSISIHADSLFCISSSVAADVRRRLEGHHLTNDQPAIRWFHLGADLPAQGLPPDPNEVDISRLFEPSISRTVIMVGTVEPRKAHALVLDAFECLWSAGVDVRLVIAGKQGWHVEDVAARLEKHPETGKRLIWLRDVSDATLTSLYAIADGFVMASEAEGFGLPLVEAAQFGTPLFVRDLPVFREIAGDNATYFRERTGVELAPRLAAWLNQIDESSAPNSSNMARLTWAESAQQLRTLLIELDRTQA